MPGFSEGILAYADGIRTFRTAVTTDMSFRETLACAATVVVWSVYVQNQ